MTRYHAPERRSLAFSEWPALDRAIWVELTRPGETILDDGGAFADSRSATNKKRLRNYGHWLTYIRLFWPDLLPAMPAPRIRPDTLAGWLSVLSRTVAPYTQLMRLSDLMIIARAMDPRADWDFLRRAVRSLANRAVRITNKEPKIRSSATLLELGLNLMRKADSEPANRSKRAAVLFRDGLAISLLALRPLRLRNLAALELGRTLQSGPAGWRITLPGNETKTHRSLEVEWPPDLVDVLETYLVRYRPVLIHARESEALWVGGAGPSLSAHTLQQAIIGRTRAALGVAINPHMFRDCAATTLAIEDPAHVGAASIILGHASSRTTHKHYIQANTLAASQRHLATMAALRNRRSPQGDGPKRAARRALQRSQIVVRKLQPLPCPDDH